jgi:hypothetical protein
MATYRIRASHVPEAWVFPKFARIVAFLNAALDVFAEAQQMARDAHKRYPFVGE